MKFNLDNYKGKYVMHCKTEEEANDFCKYLHEHGRTWCTGEYYVDSNCWHSHGDETAYNFNEGTYCDIYYYKTTNYTILEWEDFMNHTFTKENLKTGDIIKLSDGRIGVVNRHLEMIICKDGGWIDLDRVRSDLTHQWSNEFDIVLIRRPKVKAECNFDAIKQEWGALVYERQEVEEMTLEQVCKLLGKEIKIIK